MCSINHDLKAIFIHVPKTGGRYIEYILHKYYGFTIMETKNEIQHFFNDIDDIELSNIDYILYSSKEYPLTISKKGLFRYYSMSEYINKKFNMDNDKWKSYYKFTFVRNPYDRVFSSWKYCVKKKRCFSSFKDYIFTNYKHFENHIDFNNKNYIYLHGFISQYEQLVNKYKRLDINYIGRFENINNDLNIILTHLGIKNILHIDELQNNVKINETNIYINNILAYYYDHYDDSILSKVNDLFFNDFKVFNYKICETTSELLEKN
jgi:hypothetical protein